MKKSFDKLPIMQYIKSCKKGQYLFFDPITQFNN